MPPIPVTCPHCTRVELREYIMGSITACSYCKKKQQLVVCPTCKQGNSFPSCTYHDSLPFPCCGCGKASNEICLQAILTRLQVFNHLNCPNCSHALFYPDGLDWA